MTRTITQCCIMSFRNNARAIQTSFSFVFCFFFIYIVYTDSTIRVPMSLDYAFRSRHFLWRSWHEPVTRYIAFASPIYSSLFILFFFFLREFLFRWGFQTFTNGEFDSRKFVEHFAVNNGTIQSRVEAEKKKREKEKLCFLVDRICSSQGYFTYSGIVFHY